MPLLIALMLRSCTLTQLLRYLLSRALRKHTDQQLREERADASVRKLRMLQRGQATAMVAFATILIDGICIEEDRRGLRAGRLAKRAARAKARAERRGK